MKKNKKTRLINLDDALTVSFVILKLCGVIDWSWWWVLSPTLITTGISLGIFAVTGMSYGTLMAIGNLSYRYFCYKTTKLAKSKINTDKKVNNNTKTEENETTTKAVASKKEIVQQYYKFQDLSTNEKIAYLEAEKERLLNAQNKTEENQVLYQKTINNNRKN